MRLMKFSIDGGQTSELVVGPSTFFYMHALSTEGVLSVKLYQSGGAVIANLPLILKGTRYKTDGEPNPFVMVQLHNTSGSAVNCAFYVGRDDLIPPVIVSGGGGGGGTITGTVSVDSARGLSLYSAELDLTTTATQVMSALPTGATVSDWAVKVSSGTVIVSATAQGSGMTFEEGKGVAGSNSYPLYLRAETGTAKAQVLASYRT